MLKGMTIGCHTLVVIRHSDDQHSHSHVAKYIHILFFYFLRNVTNHLLFHEHDSQIKKKQN